MIRTQIAQINVEDAKFLYCDRSKNQQRKSPFVLRLKGIWAEKKA